MKDFSTFNTTEGTFPGLPGLGLLFKKDFTINNKTFYVQEPFWTLNVPKAV